MSELTLETVAAPRTFGDSTLVPAGDELGTIADQINEMTIIAGVFGDDESGAALVEEYTRVQTETAARVTADQEAIVSASVALSAISTNYQAMLEANTPQGT
jgi:hypothetical protein